MTRNTPRGGLSSPGLPVLAWRIGAANRRNRAEVPKIKGLWALGSEYRRLRGRRDPL